MYSTTIFIFMTFACLMMASTTHGLSGDCDEAVCSSIYQPVCGTDGKTYPNGCILDQHRCQGNPSLVVALDGECPKPSPFEDEECPTICSAQYQPVCGTDGKTYGNLCELNAAACQQNMVIYVAHEGEC